MIILRELEIQHPLFVTARPNVPMGQTQPMDYRPTMLSLGLNELEARPDQEKPCGFARGLFSAVSHTVSSFLRGMSRFVGDTHSDSGIVIFLVLSGSWSRRGQDWVFIPREDYQSTDEGRPRPKHICYEVSCSRV